MGIPEREDSLEVLKDDYVKASRDFLNELKNEVVDSPYDKLNTFHELGVKYFNRFERTIDEFDLPEYELNQNTANRKVEDAINIIETITTHWKIVRLFCKKHNIVSPNPSETAYASIQRLIKAFRGERIEEFRVKFQENNLPIVGFDSRAKHTGWKPKVNLLIFSLIGLAVLLSGTFLLLPKINEVGLLTDSGKLLINVIHVLLSLISGVILFGVLHSTGFVKTKKYEFGGAAAFVIVFFGMLKVGDFGSQEVKINGSIYLSEKPLIGATIKILEIEKTVSSNDFGRFVVIVNKGNLTDSLTFQVKLNEVDTVLRFKVKECIDDKFKIGL